VIRQRVVVEGVVQGVGYRMACARHARDAGLAGSVRNRPDGRVEAVFEGDAAQVAALVEWCRRGPGAARVTKVHVTEEPPRGEHGFAVG
jgi:acylphosphatase